MRIHSKFRAIRATVLTCGLALLNPCLFAAELPENARAALEKNSIAMSSVQLEYSEEKKGQLPQDYAGPTLYSAQFDKDKFFQRAKRAVKDENGRRMTEIHEDAFDGSVFYFGDPGRMNGDNPAVLAKYLAGDETDPDCSLTLVQFPYLDAAGFYAPGSVTDLKKPAIRSLVLHHVENGELAGVQQEGGRLRVIVRIPDPLLVAAQSVDIEKQKKLLQSGRNTPEMIAREIAALESLRKSKGMRTVEFVLDPQYGYGVVERLEQSAEGQIILRVEATDWKRQDAPDLWLPKHCTVKYHGNPYIQGGFSPKPITTASVELKDCEFQPREKAVFALDYKQPGSLIRDRTVPEARNNPDHQMVYTVSATGADLRRAGEDVWKETRGKNFYVLIAVNGAVIVLLIAAFGFYYRKKRVTQP